MKKIHIFIAAFVLLAISAFTLLPVSTVSAAGALDGACAGVDPGQSAVCDNKTDNTDGFVKSLVNTLLFILGALSVLAIIIGGILFVLSSGNAANVTKAKNTIVFAVVGLIVAFLAYAIVNWVTNLF
jgi:hypothetical protein